MKAGLKWLNDYLRPGDLSALEADRALTDAGLPIDSREDLPGGDVRLEVEVTSNRGDCLSHVGLAREIAAKTGRALALPALGECRRGGDVREAVGLENTALDACPRFTVHVIRDVKVGPSPAWLVERLESVGQRPINNIVDITNFINFELGTPCHAFDLDKLAGRKLIVRYARDSEPLTTLDGKQRKLKADEVVVADGERAQSLAGVIGGGDSEVSAATRHVVLEMATWDPVAVRRAARRHQVRTDASHRFERIVDARTLEFAARRAAAMIAGVSGGTLLEGMLDQGRPAEPLRVIELRVERVGAILGAPVPAADIAEILGRLEIRAEPGRLPTGSSPATLRGTVPPYRPDLLREIDLIEEIARIRGFDRIPASERMTVAVRPPQNSEVAVREIGTVLSGLGFFETVTFSFITPKQAAPFLAGGLAPLAVDDERRRGEGTLRPSLFPSLLICRKANQDGGVEVPGGVRLYETAAIFAESPGAAGPAHESRVLALVMDIPGVGKGKPGSVEERQGGVRMLRGAVESIARAMGGAGAAVEIRPARPRTPAMDAAAYGDVYFKGRPVGGVGIISPEVQRQFDLAVPVIAAELQLAPLVDAFPPASRVQMLPAFPDIERDLSLVLDESVRWEQVRALVERTRPDRLEGVSFVGTYRGKQIGPGKKSVTLRLRFRDPSRTLRHEEVDPQVAAVVQAAGAELGATVRA
jgi:phenylalanyl-tRNA synthetase beta chain